MKVLNGEPILEPVARRLLRWNRDRQHRTTSVVVDVSDAGGSKRAKSVWRFDRAALLDQRASRARIPVFDDLSAADVADGSTVVALRGFF